MGNEDPRFAGLVQIEKPKTLIPDKRQLTVSAFAPTTVRIFTECMLMGARVSGCQCVFKEQNGEHRTANAGNELCVSQALEVGVRLRPERLSKSQD
eukprot:SAG31_NODE_1132_length_9746_cov_6.720639_5_plen_96_part_00